MSKIVKGLEDYNYEELNPKDSATFMYDPKTLEFLRLMLDDFTIDCFRAINRKRRTGGLAKTKIADYTQFRKKIDAAFLILEYQGFIEARPISTMNPYFPTLRGDKLREKLIQEKEAQIGKEK